MNTNESHLMKAALNDFDRVFGVRDVSGVTFKQFMCKCKKILASEPYISPTMASWSQGQVLHFPVCLHFT